MWPLVASGAPPAIAPHAASFRWEIRPFAPTRERATRCTPLKLIARLAWRIAHFASRTEGGLVRCWRACHRRREKIEI
jgi:hypothetical protein